jgi:ribosomal protein S18 acetylase RimI-like enzyme
MSTITIRPMTADDVPVIAGWMVELPLWQRYGLTASKMCAQFEQASSQDDILLVADTDADNRACGFAWCLRAGVFGLSAYLRLIGVRPGHTGLGIGAALLKQVEHLAAETSRDLFLLTSDFNLEAQRFYHREGYEQVGAVPGYVLPDVTELIFRRRLR